MGGIPSATMVEDEGVSGIFTWSIPTGHDRGGKTGPGGMRRGFTGRGGHRKPGDDPMIGRKSSYLRSILNTTTT